MPSFQFQNGSLYYTDQGEGDRNLLLVHGFGEDASIWKDFTGNLVEKGNRVLCIDLPGVGGSKGVSPVSLDQFGDAVKSLVLHLELSRFVLVGHSMGGYTVLNAIRRYPDLPLQGFGLFHSHPYADSPVKKEGRTKTAAFIRENGSAAFALNFAPMVFAKAFAEAHPGIVEGLVKEASTIPPGSLAGQLIAMRDRRDETGTLEKAKVPVLFILGREDQLFALDTILPATLMPDVSSVHLLDGVGHMGMLEAREKCQEILITFMEFADR